MNLNGAKKTTGQIPIKILRLSSNIVSPILRDCVNSIFEFCEFPNSLKLEIVPFQKIMEVKTPPGILNPSAFSQPYPNFKESDQLSKFFKNKFSIILCGFRKHHSAQHLNLLKSWQKSLDEEKIASQRPVNC